jgi:hypothetical protein
MAYVGKVALFNLVLGKHGVSASGRILSIDEDHAGRAACDNVYHPQRRRELRRNFWAFATVRRKLRVIATTDMLFTPDAFPTGAPYVVNDIVTDVLADGQIETYIGTLAVPAIQPTLDSNQGAVNGPGAEWNTYSGPLIASEWTTGIQYYKGDLVYVGSAVWLALSAEPTISVTPAEGAMWHQQTHATALAASPYALPIGNRQFAYIKPRDLLRIAPTDPKRPQWGPDQLVESDLILTDDPGPILDLRYIRDESWFSKYDPMFVEALACNIAVETTDEMTQSTVKKTTLDAQYKLAIADARLVNAIEAYQNIEPDEDEWVTCRSSASYGFGYVR